MRLILPIISVLSAVLANPLPATAAQSDTSTYVPNSINANDVENNICAPLTVIYVKGTLESGNVGFLAGAPLFNVLYSRLNKHVVLQGVNYPADLQGDLDMGAEGSPKLVAIVNQALAQCSGTKLAIVGYSQGGLVTHYALNQGGLDSSVVDAIVYFGDPGELIISQKALRRLTATDYNIAPSGTVPASKIKEYCAPTDGVCELHTFAITPAHLSYSFDAESAADFILTTTGISG